MPFGQFQRTLGFHAGRDRDDTWRGAQVEEGERHVNASVPSFEIETLVFKFFIRIFLRIDLLMI